MPYGPNDFEPMSLVAHEDWCAIAKGCDCNCGKVEVRVLRERVAELESSIRAILTINKESTLCDEASEGSQSMELAKVLDTAECLVGWKQ